MGNVTYLLAVQSYTCLPKPILIKGDFSWVTVDLHSSQECKYCLLHFCLAVSPSLLAATDGSSKDMLSLSYATNVNYAIKGSFWAVISAYNVTWSIATVIENLSPLVICHPSHAGWEYKSQVRKWSKCNAMTKTPINQEVLDLNVSPAVNS